MSVDGEHERPLPGDYTARDDIKRMQRVTAALSQRRTFDREQVAWLIHRAFSSGLEHGLDLAYDGGYRMGRREALDEQTEIALAQLERYAGQAPYSGDATARGVARRERRAAADRGELYVEREIKNDPEWPAVAVPGGSRDAT